MEQSAIIVNFTVLLAAALIGGMVAHRLRQPVILGYLVVGGLIGPHAIGIVNDVTFAEGAATIGVALLMLTLGLEVSFDQLKQVGRVGLWGGTFQIMITLAVGAMTSHFLFGWTFAQSILFGLIISQSSTMISLKVLMDRAELDSLHGRIMIATLILQDISVVLMIVVLPLLSQTAGSLAVGLLVALGKAAVFVGLVIAAGIWFLPWLMGQVGGVRSRELFLLTVLVLCLGAALGTQVLGFSAVFGAFLIGLVLRETRFAHQALAEITPLRDIFAALFFVSLGMLPDPRLLMDQWPLVAAIAGLMILIKFGAVYGVIHVFGYGAGVALLVAAGLAQIGEFGFILAQSGVSAGTISAETYSVVIGGAVITMLLAPVVGNPASRLYRRWTHLAPQGVTVVVGASSTASPTTGTAKRVVIAGFGRVGRNVAAGLSLAGVPYCVVEIDPEVIHKLHCQGTLCVYGDATNVRVLSHFDMASVDVLVVTFPDPLAVVNTVRSALVLNPRLKVVARVHRTGEAAALRRLGVKELVSPEFEASLEFVRRTLRATGWKEPEIAGTLESIGRAGQGPDFLPEEQE